MFSFLGQLVSRFWIWFLAAWITLVLGTWLAAPSWDQIAQDKEFSFLPASAPSREAETVFQKAFPDHPLGSNIVLVLRRAGNAPDGLAADLKFIGDVVEPELRHIADEEGGLASETAPAEGPLFGPPTQPTPPPPQRSIIERIRTPNAPGTGALLISPDDELMLVVMELTTNFLSNRNWPTIQRVEDFTDGLRRQGKLPAGVDIFVTGSAVIGRDHSQAELQSARATGILTVVMVIVLLVLIYRAPFLALIPLLTIYLTVQLALNILAMLGEAGYLTLFQGLQIYITILAYGAGVDYCLFLTARYKEVLDRAGGNAREGVAEAVGDVGSALTASAATVMCGIGMMSFAQFGKFREAGLAIPLSLFFVLWATLTFSPALLRLAGRWAFWPRRQAVKRTRSAHRGLASLFFRSSRLNRGWEEIGQILARRPGACWLAIVAVMAPFAGLGFLLRNDLSYDVIGDLPGNAPSVLGTRVLQEHMPAGMMGPLTLLLVDPNVDFHSAAGQDVVKKLTDRLRAERRALELADIRSLADPLGITAAAHKGFAEFQFPADVRRDMLRREALRHYVADLGEQSNIATRLDLILEPSPFSNLSIADLQRLEHAVRDALPARVRPTAQLYFVGASASVRDLQTVMAQDRTRIEGLVLASVFVVLIVLLRRFVVPLYLLVSVLFSYFATLGVTFIVFWALDPHGFVGLDWKVAIFLFTILIAVGEDYNIFLISRVRHETRLHGPIRGITRALTRTGPVISSCGLIMAGTFGSLLAGSLTEMKQLGFALAFGVLLDTFVVRSILVPSFLLLLQTRTRSPKVESDAGGSTGTATDPQPPAPSP